MAYSISVEPNLYFISRQWAVRKVMRSDTMFLTGGWVCPLRLLKAAASALVPGSIEYIETVQDIRLDHLQTAKDHISNPDILRRVQDEVNQDCDRLGAFLRAVQVLLLHISRTYHHTYRVVVPTLFLIVGQVQL